MLVFYVVIYDKYSVELVENVCKTEYLETEESVIDLLITLYRNTDVHNVKIYKVNLISTTILKYKLEFKSGKFKLVYE